MYCNSCREALSAILDNEAADAERAAVSADVAGCESCREYGERIARVHRVMRVHPSEPVPDQTSEIMRALPPRRRRRRVPIAAGIGAVAAVAVGTLVVVRDDPIATSATPKVEVSDVVVTQAPPGGVSVLSFTVRNRSNREDALVAVTTAVAADASLHVTRDVEGRAEMHSVDQISVAPGETRELGDATSHIMLLDLHQALEPGLTVEVELQFARSVPIDVDATVTA